MLDKLKLIFIFKEPNLPYSISYAFYYQFIITLNKVKALKPRILSYFYRIIITGLIKSGF